MKHIIRAMRPKSWSKNVFIFIPIVYALELFNSDKMLSVIVAFAGFCFISSAVYLFNDAYDAEKDAAHPVKKHRPIASGIISKSKAWFLAGLLAAVGVSAMASLTLFWGSCATLIFSVIYLALNVAYTLSLKHMPIIDCFCIAAGFSLRIYIGGAASGVAVSDWLFLTVVAASLFMAFGKRRGEMIMSENADETRKSLTQYNLDFLKGVVFICAALAIVFYSLWTLERGNNMVYTVPLIIFIVSKYLLLIHEVNSHGDPTTVIFGDKTFLLSCGLYAVLTVLLLYSI
ncbi:MAG: decaprenyl-phosphate phosphoribosyltransferase [Oscillospiraceae bacterium]|nr:decaprenyl-phosphate phosphoribosyltransferase [Oscillospiraceae bacterium]